MANDSGSDYEEPVEIETSIKCPACDANLYLINYQTEIPVEGKITILTYLCRKCLYKKSYVYQDRRDYPRRIILKVTTEEDLNAMIYRSPDARILIPEVDAEIFPGEDSSGQLTTAEGVLRSIMERILPMDSEGAGSPELEDFLNRAINATAPFTIILEDRSGRSRIESPRAREEKMD